MSSVELHQIVDNLKEGLRTVITELTDETVADYVEELIQELAEECADNYCGLLDEDLQDSDEPLDFYSDMDDFSDD